MFESICLQTFDRLTMSSSEQIFLSGAGVSRRSVNQSKTRPVLAGGLKADIDPPPKPWPIAQYLAFGLIFFFTFLQFLPATHFRDPSDPLRNWIPFDSLQSSSSGNSRAPSEEKSSIVSTYGAETVHIFSWMDCLDLQMLAVLANSTLSSSSYPHRVHFHFFVPEGTEEKVSYYKLKVLFPHSNLDIIGQKDVKEKLKIATSEGEYAWSSVHEIAPFIIPSTHPTLGRFIYVSPDTIIKGRVEELFEADLSNHAIAAAEDCSKSLGDYVNFDVLDAIQRSAAKPWVSRKPYEKNACIPDLNLLLIDAKKLEKDLVEAILWWSKVLNSGSERKGQINPAIVLALYDKYLKLSSTWKVSNSTSITNVEANIFRFDGARKLCSEHDHQDIQELKFGHLWEQYLPPMANRILGD
ncbi:putative galacturonosyltransferase 6 [Tasmannia lanceolata]|uniref:putative galacturonosyltransferase 6 n=1 Tax=Tasmannia lanceolata TaxID=3420 RepID=UPI00406431C1